MHPVGIEAAIHCSSTNQSGIRESNLRCGPSRHLFLLEAGALPAASRMYGPITPGTRHLRKAGNWLSASAVLLSRMGRGRRPGRVWLRSLPEKTIAIARCLTEETKMFTSTQNPIGLDRSRHENDIIEVLHWDGRLDNRDDLLLRLRDSLNDDTGNSAIARAIYERWGVDGFVHLIGDWSVVIRNRADGSTVLASDFAGVRPLYYHLDREQVLWSSRLETLVAVTEISELDEQYIAGFLRCGGYPNRTPYKGIYSVPPGHAVCVSSERTAIRRFWSMPVGDTIRYRNRYRYEEELRELFRAAVAVRLQTESPILAELSGGLDSSSVVCVATDMMRRGAVPATGLTGLSFVWDNSLDVPFIRDVAAHCGIECVEIPTQKVPIIAERQVGEVMPEPFQPLRWSIATIARRLNAKTILTGQAGDLMMGNWFDDSLQVAKSLRSFRLDHAFVEALAWSKLLRVPIYKIGWQAIKACLPPSFSPSQTYTATDGSYAPKSIETSLTTGFRSRTGGFDSEPLFSNSWKYAAPERRKHLRTLAMMLELRQLQIPEPLQHLQYTHPFAHRPLVEFLMSVPADILCGPGEPRRLMRSAFSDYWPAKLRARRSKAVFNTPWQAALRPLARALASAKQLQVVERGIVERASLTARLDRLSQGLECNEHQLRQIIMLEQWLRNRLSNTEERSPVQCKTYTKLQRLH
jgi:asparagine synthase (glutamine-hydrolysing)